MRLTHHVGGRKPTGRPAPRAPRPAPRAPVLGRGTARDHRQPRARRSDQTERAEEWGSVLRACNCERQPAEPAGLRRQQGGA